MRSALARKALARGLETPEMTHDLDRRSRSALRERLFGERRGKIAAEIGEERLRQLGYLE